MSGLRLVAAPSVPEDLPRACQSAGVGAEAMFPDEHLPNEHPDVQAAKQICRGCPLQVREACLAGALARREPWGVWGGLSTKERFAMIRRSNRLSRGQTETLMDVAL